MTDLTPQEAMTIERTASYLIGVWRDSYYLTIYHSFDDPEFNRLEMRLHKRFDRIYPTTPTSAINDDPYIKRMRTKLEERMRQLDEDPKFQEHKRRIEQIRTRYGIKPRPNASSQTQLV